MHTTSVKLANFAQTFVLRHLFKRDKSICFRQSEAPGVLPDARLHIFESLENLPDRLPSPYFTSTFSRTLR